jgi:arylsulfatase A-like enzyme
MSKARQPTSRRKVISGIGAGALVATTGFGQSSSAAPVRPNILLVMADQEQSTRFPSGLNRPNHVRLMKSGVTFNHAYVADPVCSPSRAALFTGLYPWETGVIGNVDIYQNGPQLDSKYPTIGSVFAQQGYRTGYFGKWHLNWLVEDPIMVEDDYSGARRDQLQEYGFETSFIPTDSDDRPLGKRWDGEIARQASAWIRAAQVHGKPWLAVVSLINPHDIPFAGLYSDRPMPEYPITLPKSWNENLMADGIPRTMRRPPPQRTGSRDQFPGAFGRSPETEAEWREYIRRYYYLLEDCDRHVGTVLDALEFSGGRDNTMVFYTSDHGEMAAAHGRTAKGYMYEESVTVPLIISNPKQFKSAQVSEALCSNIDVAPTIAGCAGVRWPNPLHGIDLLRDKRDAVYAVAGQSTNLKGLVKMVRVRDWKLILYPNGDMQLFDMNKDPDEVTNLAKDPSLQNTVRELRARMDKEIA